MKSDVKAALIDWIAQEIMGKKVIAFTLNFKQRRDGVLLTEKRAIATLRRFYNGLSRGAYGPRASSRKDPAKLQFAAVYEGKVHRERGATAFHIHGVIEVPKGLTISQWESTCEAAWAGLDWADHRSHDFKRYRDEGWLEYMLKTRTKEDVAESILLDLLNLRSHRDA